MTWYWSLLAKLMALCFFKLFIQLTFLSPAVARRGWPISARCTVRGTQPGQGAVLDSRGWSARNGAAGATREVVSDATGHQLALHPRLRAGMPHILTFFQTLACTLLSEWFRTFSILKNQTFVSGHTNLFMFSCCSRCTVHARH